jgi:16S rRNA G966 N2-methylase RsmD
MTKECGGLSNVRSNDLLSRSLSILEDMVDPDECSYDHHGNCQAHGWTGIDPSCPHKRAKELLAEINRRYQMVYIDPPYGTAG